MSIAVDLGRKATKQTNNDYLSELYSEKNEDMSFDNYDEHFSNPLDYAFNCKEIRQGISKLKNNKQPGPDHVLNEFIKYSSGILLLF